MLYFWSAAMGVVFIAFVGLVVLMRIMRRARGKVEGPGDTDLAMETLVALLREGKISREEFERARASVLSRRPAEAAEAGPRRQGFEVLEPRDHI